MKNIFTVLAPVFLLSIFIITILFFKHNRQHSLYEVLKENESQIECPACECSKTVQSQIEERNKMQTVNKYPWMVALFTKRKFCGGSLINSIYVLTAAHCVHKNSYPVFARLMVLDLSLEAESDEVLRTVIHAVIHPNYNPHNADNDIALLRLNLAVEVGVSSETPNPICLTQGSSFDGMNGLVIGWGRTSINSSLSPRLQEAVLPIITNEKCERIYPREVTPNKICAGIPDEFKGPLQGDSGGPLMVMMNSKYYLVGIVSSGEPTLGTTMFTRVSQYLDWIAKNTADACPCGQ